MENAVVQINFIADQEVAGGAQMGSDGVACQVLNGGNAVIVLGNNNVLLGHGVGVGEVHGLLSLLGDGHGSQDHVGLTAFHIGRQSIEGGVDDLQLYTQPLGDFFGQLNVAAVRLAVFADVLVGRPGSVSGHGDVAALLNGIQGVFFGGLAAACQQAHGHDGNQK